MNFNKVKLSLYEAERRLEENQYVPLFELQIWLQLTYEIERKYFEAKKEAAQNQLLAAKQMVSVAANNTIPNFFLFIIQLRLQMKHKTHN